MERTQYANVAGAKDGANVLPLSQQCDVLAQVAHGDLLMNLVEIGWIGARSNDQKVRGSMLPNDDLHRPQERDMILLRPQICYAYNVCARLTGQLHCLGRIGRWKGEVRHVPV